MFTETLPKNNIVKVSNPIRFTNEKHKRFNPSRETINL